MSETDRNNHIAMEELSAFADGQITDLAERERIEQHLARCPECRQELEELRAIVQLLAELPEPELPRSFRLSPADVPSTRQAEPVPIEPWIVRHQSKFRVAAMAAVLLLAAVVTIDLLPDDGDETVDAPFTTLQEPDDPVEEAAPEADEPDAGIAGIDDDEAAAPEDDVPVDEPAMDAVEEEAPAVDEDRDTPEEMPDEEVAAPEEEEAIEDAEDPVVEPDTEPGEDDRTTRDVVAADAPDDGLSTLGLVAIGLGIVAVLLLIAGFVLPRWWSASAR